MDNSVTNNKTLDIYKDVAKKNAKKNLNAAFRAEKNNQINTYGRRTYISKLIDSWRSDSNSGTKNYWLEVSE